MGQVKAKSLIERHGFVDPDKHKPEHDKIQKWVYNNAHSIVNELFVKDAKPFKIMEREWEYKITHETYPGRRTVAGFVDLLVSWLPDDGDKTNTWPSALFEIKTSIPSLGELLRQLSFYRLYVGNNRKIVVVCPDDSDQAIIEEQGYRFLKYADPERLF